MRRVSPRGIVYCANAPVESRSIRLSAANRNVFIRNPPRFSFWCCCKSSIRQILLPIPKATRSQEQQALLLFHRYSFGKLCWKSFPSVQAAWTVRCRCLRLLSCPNRCPADPVRRGLHLPQRHKARIGRCLKQIFSFYYTFIFNRSVPKPLRLRRSLINGVQK